MTTALTPLPTGNQPATQKDLLTVAYRTYFTALDTFVRALLSSISALQTSTGTTQKYYLTTAYTVSTLPAAGVQGRRAWVTDASSPTWGGTLTGGSTTICPVFDNGTAWVPG